jgi:hypothetical protein
VNCGVFQFSSIRAIGFGISSEVSTNHLKNRNVLIFSTKNNSE